MDLKVKGGLAEVWKTVKSVITNGPYMFLVLYGTLDAIIVNGFVAFGAKYFQQQFGLTASMAGIVLGQSLNFHQRRCQWGSQGAWPPRIKSGPQPEGWPTFYN